MQEFEFSRDRIRKKDKIESMRKKIYICIVLFVLCFLVNVNYAIAQENSPPDYDKISEQIADDVEK